MSTNVLSMLQQRFACARLSHPYMTRSLSRLLTMTFTTAAFLTEAAYGSLKPPPTRRLRRALLHLSYSTTISRLLDTTRSSNRTGRFPASGSRKRLTLSPTEGSRSGVVTGPSHTQSAETLPGKLCMPVAALCVCRITTDAASGGHGDRPHCRLC